MTNEQKDVFIKRILSVKPEDKPAFGKMNVNQMVCHCTDMFRMMFGEIEGLKRQNVDTSKFPEMITKKETLPVADGLDQAAGGGTKPIDFGTDKQTLVLYLNRFYNTDDKYTFSFHPYYGVISRDQWDRLTLFHLNHHLNQFGR